MRVWSYPWGVQWAWVGGIESAWGRGEDLGLAMVQSLRLSVLGHVMIQDTEYSRENSTKDYSHRPSPASPGVCPDQGGS